MRKSKIICLDIETKRLQKITEEAERLESSFNGVAKRRR